MNGIEAVKKSCDAEIEDQTITETNEKATEPEISRQHPLLKGKHQLQ